MRRPFRQVDVFTTRPYRGNPVAVVHAAADLGTEAMQRFANWTNLSETTFLLPPTTPDADYRVRIFTPTLELPFAGHPTLGTCHAWLEAGGRPGRGEVIVQECAVGLVRLHRTDDGLAFEAPPLIREGPVDEPTLDHVAELLRIPRAAFVDAAWVDNGPGWVGVLLRDAGAVLEVRPGPVDMDVGIVGLHPDGGPATIEVRAFFPKDGTTVEDPVTGSLNASLAQWLLGSGRLRAPYTARQGTAIGRDGRVSISQAADGSIRVAGGTVTCVVGEVDL
jgi:PhzF family phenazine biosynthesis protein